MSVALIAKYVMNKLKVGNAVLASHLAMSQEMPQGLKMSSKAEWFIYNYKGEWMHVFSEEFS